MLNLPHYSPPHSHSLFPSLFPIIPPHRSNPHPIELHNIQKTFPKMIYLLIEHTPALHSFPISNHHIIIFIPCNFYILIINPPECLIPPPNPKSQNSNPISTPTSNPQQKINYLQKYPSSLRILQNYIS